MAILSTLTGSEVANAIGASAKDKVGVTVTLQHQDRWILFRCDMLDASGESVWITYPQSDHGPGEHEFSPGQRVGVTFRSGYQRFLFSAKIASVEESGTRALQLDMPEEMQVAERRAALQLDMPEEMQVAERRAALREEMPALATVEVSIWLGGQQVRPDKADIIMPVWPGTVVDICEGGCYVRTSSEVSQYIETGDIVGLQLAIGEGEGSEQILSDAQLCRSDPDGEMLMVGLQFIENDEPGQACEVYEKIKAKLREI